MTTRSEPGHGGPDRGLSAIMSERRQLINLAHRLLGFLADAEDAVQETYARWYAMPGQQRDAIESPGAWLTTVASRICLDLLSSARARRERYVGEWIPEPLPEPAEWAHGRPGDAMADPADRVTLDESVTMAFLVVLDSMTPAERVAVILHDVFGYSFAEVVGIADRTPAVCRQLASSARRRIRAAQAPANTGSPLGRHRQGLQASMGSQGHRRPHRPPGPRRDRDRRQWRPRQRPAVGCTGGHVRDPSYGQVCRHHTGHAEAVEVWFDPAQVSYPELLDVFWRVHNPTTRNRQGLDFGSQYRSAIFYHDAGCPVPIAPPRAKSGRD